MNYQDQWTRYHHKPTDGVEPSSGNGFLYTAYAVKIGLEVDREGLISCFDSCCKLDPFTGAFSLIRNPGKTTSPWSRDETLGAVALNLLEPIHLDGWNFSPYPLPRFSLLKLVKQLWELRPIIKNWEYQHQPLSLEYKHRNYFWQNNLDQLYRFAFSVPIQDRYFILKKWGKFRFYKPSHLFYAAVAKVDSLMPKKSGIKFLKYGGEKNKAAMVKDFPEDHPIVLAVKGE